MSSEYTLSDQIIYGPTTGPIISNGGAITVTGTGSITGAPDGIDAIDAPITTLNNEFGGVISGGAAGVGSPGTPAGAGVSNANTITTLINSGTILGGAGANSTNTRFGGGAGVVNFDTINTLTNSGKISGGNGAPSTSTSGPGGNGGTGIFNRGTLASLSNTGTNQWWKWWQQLASGRRWRRRRGESWDNY
jgi:hypothetical protein